MKKARITYNVQTYGCEIHNGIQTDWVSGQEKTQIVSFIPDDNSDKVNALKQLRPEYNYFNTISFQYGFKVEILSEEEAVFAE
jgi:hypothetical protein